MPPQTGHDVQQAEEDPARPAVPAHPRLCQDEGFPADGAGAELRREPAALQLRAGVAAAADQGGRPGDVRLTQRPGGEVLLDHQRGRFRVAKHFDMESLLGFGSLTGAANCRDRLWPLGGVALAVALAETGTAEGRSFIHVGLQNTRKVSNSARKSRQSLSED